MGYYLPSFCSEPKTNIRFLIFKYLAKLHFPTFCITVKLTEYLNTSGIISSNSLNSQLFPFEILLSHNNKPARGLTIDRIVVYNFWQVMMSTKAIFARQASHHHPLFCVFINKVYPRRNTCYLFQPSLVLRACALNSVDWLMAFDKKSPLCVHIFISEQNVEQWKFIVGLNASWKLFSVEMHFCQFLLILGNIRTMANILPFLLSSLVYGLQQAIKEFYSCTNLWSQPWQQRKEPSQFQSRNAVCLNRVSKK